MTIKEHAFNELVSKKANLRMNFFTNLDRTQNRWDLIELVNYIQIMVTKKRFVWENPKQSLIRLSLELLLEIEKKFLNQDYLSTFFDFFFCLKIFLTRYFLIFFLSMKEIHTLYTFYIQKKRERLQIWMFFFLYEEDEISAFFFYTSTRVLLVIKDQKILKIEIHQKFIQNILNLINNFRSYSNFSFFFFNGGFTN